MAKLEEFLQENNIEHRIATNSAILHCPNCKKEKLYIHLDELNFICFSCADSANPVRGPNATKILADISGLTYGTVKRKLGGFVSLLDFANSSITQTVKIEEPQTPVVFFPENTFRLNSDISKPAVEYLFSRGIPVDVAIKYDIRYQPSNKMLVFPVYVENLLKGYQTRSIDPNCPKNFQKRTMPGFDKSDYLMFENSIVSDEAILAEGPVSALKFARTGIGLVASMGKYVSEKQMLRLKAKGVKTIYLALDDDAFEETCNLAKKYGSDFDFYLLQLNDKIREELNDIKKPDFGDCSFDQIAIVLKEAVSFDKNSALTIQIQRLLK